MNPKRYISFFRNNKQVFYSLLLLLLVPLSIAINSFYIMNKSTKILDEEMQIRGELASMTFANFIGEHFDDRDYLKSSIDEILSKSLYGDVREITVTVPEGMAFRVLASSDRERVGELTEDRNFVLTWYQNQSIATLLDHDNGVNVERGWVVTNIVTDQSGVRLGVVEFVLSVERIDIKLQKVLAESMIIVVISISVILLLIINNIQLLEYSVLFKKLKEVDSMKDDFISVASHELRTPITAAKGFLSLALYNKDTIPKETVSDMNKVSKALDRLGTLVSDLLDVSRIEQNRLKVKKKNLQVVPQLKNVVELLRSLAEEKGLTIDEQYTIPETSSLYIDESIFRQIITNILSNAIKYTKEGKVEVRAVTLNGKMIISIQDTGVGMSEASMKQLFTKFYRIRTEETKDVVGSGLGLWIIKKLTEKMGGEISVESIEGVGTKCSVIFDNIKEKK